MPSWRHSTHSQKSGSSNCRIIGGNRVCKTLNSIVVTGDGAKKKQDWEQKQQRRIPSIGATMLQKFVRACKEHIIRSTNVNYRYGRSYERAFKLLTENPSLKHRKGLALNTSLPALMCLAPGILVERDDAREAVWLDLMPSTSLILGSTEETLGFMTLRYSYSFPSRVRRSFWYP